jgi:ketosteroid isomerase-like protein
MIGTAESDAKPGAASKEIERWVLSLFKAGDANDLETVLSFYAPDVVFRFAGGPKLHGRDEMLGSLQERRRLATKIEHDLQGIWTGVDGDFTVVSAECEVSYTVAGKGRITVPCTSTMRRNAEGLIADYRVFIDTRPAFG